MSVRMLDAVLNGSGVTIMPRGEVSHGSRRLPHARG